MRDFRKLKAYKPAFELGVAVLKLLDDLPHDRDVTIQRQMAESGTKIAAKLANGCGRGTRRGLCKMAFVSLGHAMSLDSVLSTAHRRGLIDDAAYGRLLSMLIDTREAIEHLIEKLSTPREP